LRVVHCSFAIGERISAEASFAFFSVRHLHD
jgi:hypothetical protein